MPCGSPGCVRAEAEPAVSILVGAVVERPGLGLRRSARHLCFLRGAEVQGRHRGASCGGTCTEPQPQLRSKDWSATIYLLCRHQAAQQPS